MIDYVCCLVFSENRSELVLIEKNRGPSSVVGRFNGPGGRIEEGETPEIAASREFLEETGVEIRSDEWSLVATITFPNCTVSYLSARISTERLHEARTMETEEVMVLGLKHVALLPMAPDLNWIIPFCNREFTAPVNLF